MKPSRRSLSMFAALANFFGLFESGLAPAQEAGYQETGYPPVESRPLFTPEELEQLVAPIALHPDDLISEILMASTYPLEVVEAARWVRANPGLKDDALATALEAKSWDPSVKSLVNFSQVLFMMDERLDWLQKLGDAVLAQQGEVMDAVQRLRARAMAAGNLASTPEQKVVVEDQVIQVVPVAPEVIYVPVYNPVVVYGAWPYPAYPPYICYPPGFVIGYRPYSFLPGVRFGFAWGYAWGHCQWHRRDIVINIDRNVQFNHHIDRDAYRRRLTATRQVFPVRTASRDAWQHDPSHRKGVIYRDSSTSQRFNRVIPPDARSREIYRGYPETGRPVRGSAVQPARPENRPARGEIRPAARPQAQPAAKPPAQPAVRPQVQQTVRPPVAATRPSSRTATRIAPSEAQRSSVFQGYSRGNEARIQSTRGQASRNVSPSAPKSAAISRPASGTHRR